MADAPLDGFRVGILVTDEFEQAELTGPRKALNAAGACTQIVSPTNDRVNGRRQLGDELQSRRDAGFQPRDDRAVRSRSRRIPARRLTATRMRSSRHLDKGVTHG